VVERAIAVGCGMLGESGGGDLPRALRVNSTSAMLNDGLNLL
jgi:hypothetical protein